MRRSPTELVLNKSCEAAGESPAPAPCSAYRSLHFTTTSSSRFLPLLPYQQITVFAPVTPRWEMITPSKAQIELRASLKLPYTPPLPPILTNNLMDYLNNVHYYPAVMKTIFFENVYEQIVHIKLIFVMVKLSRSHLGRHSTIIGTVDWRQRRIWF